MVANIANAVASYGKVAGIGQGVGGMADIANSGASFKSFLDGAGKDLMQSQAAAEQVSQKAAAGKANLIDVMTAVNNADVTLQTIVSVRDKLVTAIQDLMRTAV